MQTKPGEINQLICKKVLGELNEGEKQQLDEWIARSDVNRHLYEKLIDPGFYSSRDAVKEKIWKELSAKTEGRIIPLSSRWMWNAAAIAVLVLITVGIYTIYTGKRNDKAIVDKETAGKPADKSPGKDGAILQLADGTVIVIDSMANGNLASQGNTTILKQDGKVAYTGGDQQKGNEVLYNTLTTPRARQVQLVLPDGSNVWLNASSSITFPAAFSEKERRVEITGEVYFEIAKDKTKPFIVHTSSSTPGIPGMIGGMDVQVLGTHFNINAYSEEGIIKTTLLEGLVKVTAPNPYKGKGIETAFLKPGQQAALITGNAGGNLEAQNLKVISNADVTAAVAWKNGLIVFDNSDIKAILRQISRWYDVNILYEENIPSEEIKGTIPRKMKLSEALHALELSSGLKFNYNGTTIIVNRQGANNK